MGGYINRTGKIFFFSLVASFFAALTARKNR